MPLTEATNVVRLPVDVDQQVKGRDCVDVCPSLPVLSPTPDAPHSPAREWQRTTITTGDLYRETALNAPLPSTISTTTAITRLDATRQMKSQSEMACTLAPASPHSRHALAHWCSELSCVKQPLRSTYPMAGEQEVRPQGRVHASINDRVFSCQKITREFAECAVV